jgi:hybrid cluster-associated redox disulfide protein
MTSHFDRDSTLDSLPINALLDRWPAAAVVFIRYQMACIGCDFSGFHTPADAAHEYQIPQRLFFQDLGEYMTEPDRD